MNLSKLSMVASVGALTAAAFVLTPVATSVPVQSQAGTAQPGESLKGLLRPTRTDSSQEEPGGATRGQGAPLTPVTSSAPDRVGQSLVADRDELEEQYRLRLSQSDLDGREMAFDEIVGDAGVSSDSRAALEAIASDLGDPDLAFTARLALREIDRNSQARARGLLSPHGQGFTSDPFEAMQHRMEEMLQSDPFVRDLFTGDPFAGDPFFSRGGGSLFRRRPGLFGSGGGASVDPFEAMRERTEEIRKQFEDLQSSTQSGTGGTTRSFSSSSSMSVETTADGVRVEITEDDGSGPNTRVYEAPSMEALLEANPELKGRVR